MDIKQGSKYRTDFEIVDLNDVLSYFSGGFKDLTEYKRQSVESFVDVAKGKVIFKIISKKD